MKKLTTGGAVLGIIIAMVAAPAIITIATVVVGGGLPSASAATQQRSGFSIELAQRPRQLASGCLIAAVHSGAEPTVKLAEQCVRSAKAVFAATAD